MLPLGARRARQRWATPDPPVGLDAQADYKASLRLALARRERDHRPEHLALALVAPDPGVAWILDQAALERTVLLDTLAAAYPPPRLNRSESSADSGDTLEGATWCAATN